MALSGSFATSAYTHTSGTKSWLVFSWTASQSVEDNRTTISWTLKGARSSSSGYVNAGGFKVVVDGITVYSKSTDYRIELRDGTVVASGTKTLTHKDDGERAFSASVEAGIYTFAVNCKGSSTFNLDTIARASTIKCTEAYIGEKPIITINKSSPKFTHTVKCRQWDDRPLITIAEKTSATTITDWTIPTTFYEKIPDAPKTSLWLECTTYNGNTELGTRYCMFVAYADETKCKPSVSGSVTILDDYTRELTGREDTIIRYCSMVRATMDVEEKNGASIVLTTINNNVGTDWGTGKVETNVFDFYAKDSRGFSNSDKVVFNMIPYTKLTNESTAQRTDPTSGKAALTIKGNWFNNSFGAVDNTLRVRVRRVGSDEYVGVIPNISGNEYSANITLFGLDYTQSHDIEVEASDKVGTSKKTITIPKGIPVFDWGEEDFNFNVPVTINGVDILEKLAELEALLAKKG